MPQRHSLTAPADAAGRADRFLAAALPALSRARIQQLIGQGAVRCDGAILADSAQAVRPGARYHVEEPDPVDAQPQAQAMKLAILHEDEDLIVLDKPPGLVVHPAPGNPDHTLVNALLAHCGAGLTGVGGERRPGIVHRLDKDTSGVMVVAKNEATLAALSAAFAARDLERLYLALCWGLPGEAQGSIEAPIGRDPRDRKRMAAVARNGKPALTHWRLLRAFGTGAALLECRLATGRTHQIRVHMAHAGHPIVGDPLYLRRRPAAARALPPAAAQALLDFPRQALHAAILGFRHPRTGKPLRFQTPPPADLRALLDLLTGP